MRSPLATMRQMRSYSLRLRLPTPASIFTAPPPDSPFSSGRLPPIREEASCSRAYCARERRARVVVRGLRAVSDYESEIQLAMVNAKLNPRLDTVFLYTSPKYAYLSSSVVKEMARYGADLGDFVPRQIIRDVEEKTRMMLGKES